MDELLVEFCRSGTLGPVVLGMSSTEVFEQIGKPGRIKNGQGDDCFQWYRYSRLELTMRCFARDPGIRRGAGRDLALAAIGISLGGRNPLVLPEAIAHGPIAAAPLQLTDAHRFLDDRGVEMTRDRDQMLTRTLDEASIRIVSADDGFVLAISAGWRPRPGGWYYSEEDETGIWVTGDTSQAGTSGPWASRRCRTP